MWSADPLRRGRTGRSSTCLDGLTCDALPVRAGARRGALRQADGFLRPTRSARPRSRPDHPNSHRFLAYSLVRMGRLRRTHWTHHSPAPRGSIPAGASGRRPHPVRRCGLIAAAWIRKEPGCEPTRSRAPAGHRQIPTQSVGALHPELGDRCQRRRFPHLRRSAAAMRTTARSSCRRGELYADVTTGYGPECSTYRSTTRAGLIPHAAGALLFARPDGLRHGQAADRRARRQRRSEVRGPAVHHHGRPRLRRSGGVVPSARPKLPTSRPASPPKPLPSKPTGG